jgi:O-antigen/teichoic acid export membrane protein/GT2 family glycosyltransferase
MSELVKQQAKTAERLVKNSLWLFGAEAVSKLVALATQVIAARYLGKEGYGVFSFAFAFSGAFIVFVDAGLGVYISRELTRRPERLRDLLGTVFALKGLVSLVTVAAIAGCMFVAPLERDARMVVGVVALALLLNGYTDASLAAFRALEKMARVAVLMVIQRLVFFVLAFGVLALGHGAVAFSLAFLAGSIATYLLSRRPIATLAGRTPLAWKGAALQNIFRAALPVCGVFLFTYIYFRIDAVLIFFLLGESETGWYAAAFKLTETLSLLAASIRGAIFPLLARTFAERGDGHQRIWSQAGRTLALISLPLAAGIFLLAPGIIAQVFGEDYTPARGVLSIMVLAFPLLCLNDMAAHLLVSENKTRPVLLAAASAALFNGAANVLAIPRIGIEGAAGVAVLTQGLLFLLLGRALVRAGIQSPILRWFWRPALAAGGMAAGLHFAATTPLAAQIVLGAGIYLLLLALLQGFNEYDRLILRGIFHRPVHRPAGPPMGEVPAATLDLSIVTVNCNSTGYLRDCLNSLESRKNNFTREVIVVDNASTDGCAEMMRREFPGIRLIANSDNLGFARACNQGIRTARGRYLLLLNNDTRVPEGALEKLLEIMDRSRDIGLLGCRLTGADGRVQLSFGRVVGFGNEFGRKFFLMALFARSHRAWARKILDWIHGAELEVDWVRGACMLIRREALREAGLMDENFFLYFEEVDLGVRIRRLGWRVVYTPAVSIIHHGQGSIGKSRRRAALAYRNSQMYFYKKHYGSAGLYLLRIYLSLKMQKNRLRALLRRMLGGQAAGGAEETEGLNEEILLAVKNFR